MYRYGVLPPSSSVVKDFNYPMSIQLRQCSTNHAYATLWLKDSYIIVLVVWKVDRCLTLYLGGAFFRPCDLNNQHALVHLMKYRHQWMSYMKAVPLLRRLPLASGIDIDPSTQHDSSLEKKSTGSPVDLNQRWPGVSVVQGLRNPPILEGPRIATW